METKLKTKQPRTPENPYVAGRREWNERYGSYISREFSWKVVAFASLFIALIAVVGIIFIGSQSKIIPYVVEVDKLGRVTTVGSVDGLSANDEKVIMSNLADFISNFRTIWVDVQSQKKMLLDAYKFIAPGSAAEKVISSYFRNNDPFANVGKYVRSVQIIDVLKVENDSWQIDWKETTTTSNGTEVGRETFRALIQIQRIPPTTTEDVYKNPLGIYVKVFSFTKTL